MSCQALVASAKNGPSLGLPVAHRLLHNNARWEQFLERYDLPLPTRMYLLDMIFQLIIYGTWRLLDPKSCSAHEPFDQEENRREHLSNESISYALFMLRM